MKQFLAAHIIEVIAIIIAAITAIGVFVGPWLASRRQRKIAEQDRKLRAHFEEVKSEAEDLVSLASSLKEKDMRIVAVDISAAELGVGYVEIRAVQISDSFKAHFLGQMEEWRTWEEKAIEHNISCEDFRQKIKTAFESKGIPVGYQDALSAYIHEDAFKPLLNMWEELARGKHPWPDFQKIEFEPIYNMKGASSLYASGWKANAVAFAMTAADSEKCKAVLAEVAENEENQREAAKLYNSANEHVEQAKGFADQFASKLNDMDTFWPPKKPNEFKKLKKTCPKCKELF